MWWITRRQEGRESTNYTLALNNGILGLLIFHTFSRIILGWVFEA